MSARIVVIGSVNTDLVVRGPRIPSPGETVTGGTLPAGTGRKGSQPGRGSGAGRSRCHVRGTVGDDELGEAAIAGLRGRIHRRRFHHA